MIRSELRSALRRCPAEEGRGEGGPPVGQLQSLIAQRMQRAQELLEELRLQVGRLRLQVGRLRLLTLVLTRRSCRRPERSGSPGAAPPT